MSEMLKSRISNVTLTDADTEYSLVLTGSCKHFSLQCRTAFAVRFAFVTGQVATPTEPYATVKSGGAFSSPDKFESQLGGLTLYLASSQAAVVVEVVEWY